MEQGDKAELIILKEYKDYLNPEGIKRLNQLEGMVNLGTYTVTVTDVEDVMIESTDYIVYEDDVDIVNDDDDFAEIIRRTELMNDVGASDAGEALFIAIRRHFNSVHGITSTKKD